MRLPLSVLALIAVVLILAVALFVAFGPDRGGGDDVAVMPAPAPEAIPSDGAADTPGATRSYFLRGADFGPDDARPFLILHAAATGGAPRVVTDRALLEAARESAFFTEHTGAALEVLLLSVVFLSPPGNGIDTPFATLKVPGRDAQVWRCLRAACSGGAGRFADGFAADIDALLAASQPLEERYQRFDTHADYVAAVDETLGSERAFLDYTPPDYPEPANTYEGSFRIYLPGLITALDGSTDPDAAAANRAAELDAALRAGLDGTGLAYEMAPVRADRADQVQVTPMGAAAPLVANGAYVAVEGFAVHAFRATVSGPQALHDRVRPGLLDGLAPTDGDEAALTAAANRAAAAAGEDCADCFEAFVDVPFVDAPIADLYAPQRYGFTSYVIPDSPN
ncbi:hypothetical protein GQ651_05350 [Alphaproteobacteria bacterium GH1-50]|uniref:Uncharacterized protein n=1 Tax=Kangsaoukella pontilimi TaxID=2691042 RepID=A0A7C9IFC3_9RHOB|nr:hypothetical protein [Kangsaoukella pontilimi]MXQ07267.1 hypothetical protein [Kangsaoukella pontilimi]